MGLSAVIFTSPYMHAHKATKKLRIKYLYIFKFQVNCYPYCLSRSSETKQKQKWCEICSQCSVLVWRVGCRAIARSAALCDAFVAHVLVIFTLLLGLVSLSTFQSIDL